MNLRLHPNTRPLNHLHEPDFTCNAARSVIQYSGYVRILASLRDCPRWTLGRRLDRMPHASFEPGSPSRRIDEIGLARFASGRTGRRDNLLKERWAVDVTGVDGERKGRGRVIRDPQRCNAAPESVREHLTGTTVIHPAFRDPSRKACWFYDRCLARSRCRARIHSQPAGRPSSRRNARFRRWTDARGDARTAFRVSYLARSASPELQTCFHPWSTFFGQARSFPGGTSRLDISLTSSGICCCSCNCSAAQSGRFHSSR